MEQDLISIIIPCYNAERFLDDCFLSIKNQTYQNLEIIFVDDGSTDNTGKLLDGFAMIDNRVKVIHKSNKGVNAARNTALENANGLFFYFIDADDVIAKDTIEILHELIKKHDTDVATGKMIMVKENYKISNKQSKRGKVIYREGSDNVFAETLSIPIGGGTICGKLYTKDSLSRLPNYPSVFNEHITYAEDLLFCIKYYQLIEKSVRIKTNLYFYREVASSSIHSKFNDKSLSAFLAIDAIEAIDKNKFPVASKYGQARICLTAMDLIEKLSRTEYHNPEIVRKIYSYYKNNLIVFPGLSRFPLSHRFGVPLTHPVMYLMIRKKLKG